MWLMGRGLAYRKHATEKAKRRVRKIWTCINGFSEPSRLRIGRMARTPKPCSCMSCGNPRHHFHGDERFTMQERRDAPWLRPLSPAAKVRLALERAEGHGPNEEI